MAEEPSIKKSISFMKATEVDIPDMVRIEAEFFGSYDRAFDDTNMKKWFAHNSDMFYVVKDDTDKVMGFTIMTPVSEQLYQELREGQVGDLYDFKEEDVATAFESDYFYIADICVSKSGNDRRDFRVSNILLAEMMKIMYSTAKVLVTTPITEDGQRMAEHIGFKPVSYDSDGHSICELEVNPENYSKFARLVERVQRMM